MQTNATTREHYAESEATADGETIILMTIAPHSYIVTCWRGDECRWDRSFGSNIAAAIEEYNKWAKTPEKIPEVQS